MKVYDLFTSIYCLYIDCQTLLIFVPSPVYFIIKYLMIDDNDGFKYISVWIIMYMRIGCVDDRQY